MKLNKDYIVHDTGSEFVLVPTGKAEFSGIVRGNKTLGAILELLKNEMTEEEIVSAMKTRFSAPEGAVERDVAKVIDELRKIGAIDG